ncbi:MAG: hypothetical protein LBB76_08335 [Azoarcus sp.]|jgi:predicted nucleic acid-binding protein|nr:hypothetical protein [Azoarcus sp.]
MDGGTSPDGVIHYDDYPCGIALRPIGLFDASIAVIAKSRGARWLATRNVKDFADCGIEIINPWLD